MAEPADNEDHPLRPEDEDSDLRYDHRTEEAGGDPQPEGEDG